MVFSSIVFAAAFDAGGRLAERLHARHNRRTLGAGVKKFARDAAAFEGELMAARFVGNPQVSTGLAPLLPMGLDATAADAVMGEQMGEFVAERALNLGGGNFHEFGI
jgi:hypothetical protein